MFRIGVQSIAMNGEINLFMRRGVCPPQEMDQFLTLYMNHWSLRGQLIRFFSQ